MRTQPGPRAFFGGTWSGMLCCAVLPVVMLRSEMSRLSLWDSSAGGLPYVSEGAVAFGQAKASRTSAAGEALPSAAAARRGSCHPGIRACTQSALL